MKPRKKIVSLALSITMLFGIVTPGSVFAATGDNIVYKANGGSPSEFIDNKGGAGYGSADPYTIKTQEATSFTYDNHEFIKWNTAANGLGEGYASGDTGTYAEGLDLELYALWSLNAPTGVTAAVYKTNKIEVKWNELTNVNAFKVERKAASEADYTILANIHEEDSYVDSTVVVNTPYTYRVTGVDGSYAAKSAVSNEVKVNGIVTDSTIPLPAITGYQNAGATLTIGTTIQVTPVMPASGTILRYTTNDTDPDATSPEVTKNGAAYRLTIAPSVTLPNPITVKIIADNGTSISNVYTHTFEFKLVNPADVLAGVHANDKFFPAKTGFTAAKDTTIYYAKTTDGSEPSKVKADYIPYTDAIALDKGVTTRIKAFARGNGGLATVADSDIVEFTYKIDSSLKSLEAIKKGEWTDAQKKELIREVIGQLTLDEKIDLIGGTKGTAATGTAIKNSGAAGGTFTTPRLMSMGIAPMTLSDGPAGVRMGYKATTWTSPTALASSWDEQVVHEIGIQTGKEASFYGIDLMLSPGQNILRNPQSGRNFEYYSEDSFLSGTVAREFTAGTQSENVGVTLKHYAGNEQETYRSGGNTIVSERALREVYLKGFEMAADAKPWSVMASYNRLNGTYAAQNEYLMTDMLRNEFGFDGFVMSDWGATQDIIPTVKAQMDLTESSLSAAKKAQLKAAILSGELSTFYLDQVVANILGVLIRTNIFNDEYGKWGEQYNLLTKEQDFYASTLFAESNEIAHRTSTESMVLLKNDDQLLPLQGDKSTKVGLVTSSNLKGRGGFGDNAVTSSDFVTRGGGSAGVYFDPTHPSVISLEQALGEKFTLTNAGAVKDIKEAAGYGKKLTYTKDTNNRVTGITLEYTGAFDQDKLNTAATDLAAKSDYGIYVVSRQTGEGADNALRGNDGYYLTDEEIATLKAYATAFHAANKKLVVILNIGSALDTSVVDEYADVILISWLPGQEGGRAITDVLSGVVNPSGKLTQTFTKKFEYSPSILASQEIEGRTFNTAAPTSGNAVNSELTNGGWGTNPVFYDEGVLVGYKWFDSKITTEEEYNKLVAYPFGFGLSYTNYEYSNLKLNKSVFDKDNAADTITATATVKNTGTVKGKEVVELYIGMENFAAEGRPMKDLRGYQKVELEPGQSKEVTFTIELTDLEYYDDAFDGVLTGSELISDVKYDEGKGWTVTPDSKFNVIVASTSNNYVINDAAAKQALTAQFVYGTPASNPGGGDGGLSGGSGSGGGTPTPTPTPIPVPTPTPAVPVKSLDDMFTDAGQIPAWAKEAISVLVNKGIMQGKGNGIFDHAGLVTRAELVTMLVRAFDLKQAEGNKSFSDVAPDAWFKSFIDIATSNGIAQGLGNGQFGPKNNISRQDLSVMIHNALKALDVKIAVIDSVPFTDDAKIAGYAKEATKALKQLGIIEGREDGKFDPQATATRAEAAVMLDRVLDYIVSLKK